jgi:hypothetical protein
MNYIAPDYGTHHRQDQEWRELTGLDDPADRYDPPAGPPIRMVFPTSRYPLDEARP